MENQQLYPIRVVSSRTGLTPHVIRAWEKRYGAITPERSDGNRRLYNEEQIERLQLFRAAIDGGFSIGNIGELNTADLRTMVDNLRKENASQPTATSPPSEVIGQLLGYIHRLDSQGFKSTLYRLSIDLTLPALIYDVIIPLMELIGRHWHEGHIRVYHEHFATTILRNYLYNLIDAHLPAEGAPTCIATTPQGQFHEIGALLLAVFAALDGWQVNYFGPSMPAREIAAAVTTSKAGLVMLSAVFPIDDNRLHQELKLLREGLPKDCQVLLTGAATQNIVVEGVIRSANMVEARTIIRNAREPQV
jgi:DNA-binding transcriptional MerR regulator